MSGRHLAVAGALAAGLLAGQGEAEAGDRLALRAYPGESYTQYYYGRGGYYPRYYRRGPSGGAVAAGVVGGLAAGAIIGGALAGAQAAPAYPMPAYGANGPGVPVGNVYGRDPNWVSYCASRYPGFDPISGTFLASDGFRYPCR